MVSKNFIESMFLFQLTRLQTTLLLFVDYTLLTFYGDLVHKFKKNMGMSDFSDQFRKTIKRNKRIGYDLNAMR